MMPSVMKPPNHGESSGEGDYGQAHAYDPCPDRPLLNPDNPSTTVPTPVKAAGSWASE